MKTALLIAAATLTLAGSASAANLIVNGGFEDQTFPGTTTYYNIGPNGSGADHMPLPAGFGWSVPTNNVDIISYTTYGAGGPANGGSYGLDLVGYGSNGEISQTLGTTVGQKYSVTFDYESNPDPGDASADVLVNGGSIGSVTGTGAWQTFTGTFTGTGSDVFAINELFGADNGGVFLDNVSVTPVPEPAAWALMLVGFCGLGAALRARRRLAAA